ncbi:MAG: CHASE2 domain-containing protein [Verrucomicrobiales bacterium]|nr:CHASE2 domain-containing protein [Verrucomicrobiales bacterium]
MNTIVSTRTLRIFAIGLAIAMSGAAFICYSFGLTAGYDQRASDMLSRMLPGKTPATPPVMLVTIQDVGQQIWPWTGLDYAVFLNAIAPFKPAVVAIDIPQQSSEADYKIYDLQFGKQIRHLNRVVLPAQALTAKSPNQTPLDVLPGKAPAHLLAVNSLDFPPPDILSSAKLGIPAIPLTVNQQSQKIPLILGHHRKLVPSFVLQTYAQYLSADWDKSESTGTAIILRDSTNRELARIPIDSEGCLSLHYQVDTLKSQANEFYQLVVSSEQIRNNFPPLIDLTAISGKILLVGAEAPNTYQPVNTAKGSASPVRVQYQALKDLFAANFLRPAPTLWLIAALLLTSLTASQLALCKNLTVSVLLEIAWLAVIAAGGAVLMSQQQWLFPFAVLLATNALTWTLTAILFRLNEPNPDNPYKTASAY